ncbi:metallo-beta-lactamase domain-containing protein 1-like [Pollicipes pollicipes]|uniref:metallo-beta-lactamase domain-containing protein 1-like n=1 Tax=Pollicipes pollicipes TaxID=41117 RepID=UPI00188552EC|nr:metallo-beta-lactamase domain-containing protein 1-like [Pollicipes pollicipes]
MSAPKVHVLVDGYSVLEGDGKSMRANCTCSVVEGPPHIIVDTMTAWDAEKVLQGLSSLGLQPEDISYAVATHGHCDHVGNLNLFQAATHVVGTCVSRRDVFTLHDFDSGGTVFPLFHVLQSRQTMQQSVAPVANPALLPWFVTPLRPSAEPYKLSEFVDVIATPGHTSEDVSVRVRSRHQGLVIIAGTACGTVAV